ncbi:hypothetical protein EJ07DRAFT_160141 [Lizonia empirigonia]|nr:hypothetical protein EJ07DRAFT_160141 [Lizonia empirigonia]
MVLIALLLAGYYDGPATINDTAMAAHKQVHAPLWQAVREHLNDHKDKEVQTQQEQVGTTTQHPSTLGNQKRSLPTEKTDDNRVIKRAKSENNNTVKSSKDADESQHLMAKLEEEKRGCTVKLEEVEVKLKARVEDERQTKERCIAVETIYNKQNKTLGALREENTNLKEKYVTLKTTLNNSEAKVHEQANAMHDLSAAKAESNEKITNQKKKIEALQASHIASCTQIADLRAKQAISHKTITEMKEEVGELQKEEGRHRQDRIRHAMDTCRPLYEMRRRKLRSQGLSEAEASKKAEEFYHVEFKRHL